jgi:hypothetical protein
MNMIINFCIWVLQKRITNVALEKPLTLPRRGLLKAIHNLLNGLIWIYSSIFRRSGHGSPSENGFGLAAGFRKRLIDADLISAKCAAALQH